MNSAYITDKEYKHIDFTKEPLPLGDYDNCSFSHCNLAGVDLSKFHFMDCRFDQCDLSLAKLQQTSFSDVHFSNCKMLGLLFGDCRDLVFTSRLEHCILNHASFYQCKIRKGSFIHCSMKGTDLTEADCSGTLFQHCDLENALFDGTNLEKADLRTSFHYSIDPERNRLKKARFSLDGVAGLLQRYGIIIE